MSVKLGCYAKVAIMLCRLCTSVCYALHDVFWDLPLFSVKSVAFGFSNLPSEELVRMSWWESALTLLEILLICCHAAASGLSNSNNICTLCARSCVSANEASFK